MNKKKLERDYVKYSHLDEKYVWHPFTQTSEWNNEKKIIIDEGSGIFLKDIFGKKYIDGVSSLWCNLFGHRIKEIDNAIKEQLNKISHTTMLGLTHIPAIELSKNLVSIVPSGLNKVFFSDSGSEAIEIALKIAYQYWSNIGRNNKKTFLTLKEGYHGDTIGAISLGGIDLFHSLYKNLVFKTIKMQPPYCYRCPYNMKKETCKIFCLQKIICEIEKRKDELAAVVIEPIIQCAGGMIVQPDGFLKSISVVCKKNNVLLILDEVATGFGRTGKMFACEWENVTPDIIVLAKGLTGGYLPLAATITSEKIFNAFTAPYEKFKTFFHGHTYTGNPLACVSAIATVNYFKKHKIISKLKNKIKIFQQYLDNLRENKFVGDIRCKGLIVGIEVVKDKDTKESFPLKQRIGRKICLEARKYGIIIRPLGDIVVLNPPLTISIKQIKYLLRYIALSIDEIGEKY